MRHIAIAFAAVAFIACKPAAKATDSLPPIDTLKPAVAVDTLTPSDSAAIKTKAPVNTKTGTTGTKTGSKAKGELRDSAFGPPKNLPRLDTLPTKRRPPV
jgi:hypothetical protein